VILPGFHVYGHYEAVLGSAPMPVIGRHRRHPPSRSDDIPNKIPATQAIIPSTCCGAPARIDKIMKVAKTYKLSSWKIKNARLAGERQGKYTGTFGQMGIFSFDHIQDDHHRRGGMILTDDLKTSTTAP